MRSTTWPAPTSVHDLQPGRRSLRLKGVKLGAAEIRTPIRGLGPVAPRTHPYTGFWRPLSGSFFSPLSGVWDPGARHLGPFKSPLCGVFATPFGVLFLLTPIRGLGPWRQAPWLQVTPTRGFATPFGVFRSHPFSGFCSAMMKSYGNLTS